jgi:hypothetical protein
MRCEEGYGSVSGALAMDRQQGLWTHMLEADWPLSPVSR